MIVDTTALQSLSRTYPEGNPSDERRDTVAIRQFAADNGFSYCMRDDSLVSHGLADSEHAPAWLGESYALGKQAYHVVSGQIAGYACTLFIVWENQVNGVFYSNPTPEQQQRYAAQQSRGIVRVQLPKVFPQVFLDSNKNDRSIFGAMKMSSVWVGYQRDQQLPLEGNFAEYFDFYSPKGLHVNTLSLIAPNFMAILQDHAHAFDVEFYGNEMILVTKLSLYTPETMAILEQALVEQLTYLDRLMPSWNYTPLEPPFDRLEKGGTSLFKIGRFRISPLLFVVLFMAIVIVLIIVFWSR